MALVVKNLPANSGDLRYKFDPWVGKIPWRRKMATHSRILASKIAWTEGYSSWSRKESRHN